MAGEIEEPFRLNLQVDSVHSGSISFGRFESEVLCWERRSSFSHNKYLEEVERCSKPGSVTEKKSLLEAHFRRKGFMGLNSPGCLNEAESWSNRSDVPVEMINDEEIGQMKDSFDETEVYVTPFSEPQSELAGNDSDHLSENGTSVQADGAELHSLIPPNSLLGVEKKNSLDGETANLDENSVSDIVMDEIHGNHTNLEDDTDPIPKAHQQGSSSKERTTTEAECKNPRATARNRVKENRRSTSSNAPRVSEKKVSKTVAVRSTMEIASQNRNRYLMHETSKHKPDARTKRVDKLNSAEKDSTNRSNTGPKLCQSTNRASFQNNEHAQRRKEFDLKVVAKMHAKEAKIHEVILIVSLSFLIRAYTSMFIYLVLETYIMFSLQERKTGEIKQLAKSLQFKAISGGVVREPHGPKAATSDRRLPILTNKASNPRTGVTKNLQSSNKGAAAQTVSRRGSMRTSDPPQASATSCHSTVTSESCTSSPVRASNRPAGKRVITKKKELEKERPTSFLKNKVPESKQKIRIARAGQVAATGTS